MKGPPGCGKTQLARQFGKEYMKVSAGCGGQSPRRIVATLDARTPESLLESYKELHQKLDMSKESEERASLNELIKTYSNEIKNHLRKSSTVWLLIIDNLTVNDPLREFLPTPEENSPWGEGLVLVTTQDSKLVPRSHAYAKVVDLDKGMEKRDAKKLLSAISGLEADEDAIKVAQLLGFYPLSLACAAVYVKQMREDRPFKKFSWKNYFDHCDFIRHNLCNPQSMMLPVVEFAARQMAENNEVLRAAFVFLSYCALQPVPLDTVAEYVLYETAASGDKTIRVPDDVKIEIAECSLLIYSETGERGIEVVTLHRVMRLAFAQIRRKPDVQTKEMEETAEVEKRQLNGVLEILNKAYKIRRGDVSKEAIATRIILWPHLREFVEKAENSQFVEVNLLVQALVYLADDHSELTRHNPCYPQSMLPAAEFAARRVAENNEVLRAAFVFLSYCALRPVPLDTVAEYVLYETAASGDKTIRVPDDVKIEISRCSLLIYPETGERGIEVVTLHQVMRLAFAQIRRKPDVQTKEMEETAEVEKRQLNGVLRILNKAYKIRKGDVSKEAIATRIILCPHLREFVEKAENSQFVEMNLLVQALVYLADGLVHVAGATDNNRVALLERAYKTNKQLSKTDISACELLCDLGYAYCEAGQLDRAIPVLEEANHLCTSHTEPQWMKMRSRVFNNLAFTYRESFQLDLAKEYMKMCAEVTRKAYGEKHVQVVERLCNLGIILHDHWENDEAIEVLEEAQEIIEACDTSGTELFFRAQVLNYTAKVHLRWYLGLRYTHPNAWSTKKHLEESNALHEEAVKIYEELHGVHKFTAGTMMTYGTAKLHLGQVEQAYEMCQSAFQFYRSSGHIAFPRAGTWLADVFLVRKEYARAKSFLEELVKVHEDLHLVVSPGAYHPKALLAEACVHLGNVRFGKEMLTQCLREWEEKGMHPQHYWVARARAFLRLHEEQHTDDAVPEL